MAACPICNNVVPTLHELSFYCKHSCCFKCMSSHIYNFMQQATRGQLHKCTLCAVNGIPAPESIPAGSLAATIPPAARGLVDPRCYRNALESVGASSDFSAFRRFARHQFSSSAFIADAERTQFVSCSCPQCDALATTIANAAAGTVRCVGCALVYCSNCQQPYTDGHNCRDKEITEAMGLFAKAPQEARDIGIVMCPGQCGNAVKCYKGHNACGLICTMCQIKFCPHCAKPTNGGHNPEECKLECAGNDQCHCAACPDCRPGKPCTFCDGCPVCAK